MTVWLVDAYPWIKALHVISVIAWMAGMLYLPRLFVYHSDADPGSDSARMLKVMERRLFYAIITPAMFASLLLGLVLAMTPGIVDWSSLWPYAKLVLLAGMFEFYHLNGRWRRAFAEDRNRHGARFFRYANEVPTVLMIAIVIIIIVKPL